jgi:hypothetical protein
LEDLSHEMKNLAEQAVVDARTVHGIDLDYTPESIQRVEQILSGVYNSKPRGLLSRLFGRALSGDDAARLARMYGSYVGESLRRKWCYKRLMNGPEDNIWHKVLTIYLNDRVGNELKFQPR